MKNTQRLFALLLAVVMVLSMAVTAFADGIATTALLDTGILKLQNVTAGYNYDFYRILDIATISEGTPVYVLREAPKDGSVFWDDFFAEGAAGANYFQVSGGYVKPKENFDDLSGQQLATDVKAFADLHKITPDIHHKMTISGDTESKEGRQYGYYVMVTDRPVIDADNPKYTTFVLKTPSLTITEKNVANPYIEKFVQEDSAMHDADGGWRDEKSFNVAEIEQPVKFKIIVHLVAGTDTYTITDTYNTEQFEPATDIKFEYSGGGTVLVRQENSPPLENDEYDVHLELNNNGFEVETLPGFRKMMENNQTLTITYSAKLKPTAVIGGEGNRNNVRLDYIEKNIEAGTATAKHSEDYTVTKTYKMRVQKVDENQRPLDGATFKLYKEGSTDPLNFSVKDNVYTLTNKTQNVVDEETGTVTETITNLLVPNTATETGGAEFFIYGLDTIDHYVLKEENYPVGYVKMTDLLVIIDPEDSANFQNDTYHVVIPNLPGIDMPTTGGMGTTIIYAVGGLMVLAAVVLLVTKKRMAA